MGQFEADPVGRFNRGDGPLRIRTKSVDGAGVDIDDPPLSNVDGGEMPPSSESILRLTRRASKVESIEDTARRALLKKDHSHLTRNKREIRQKAREYFFKQISNYNHRMLRKAGTIVDAYRDDEESTLAVDEEGGGGKLDSGAVTVKRREEDRMARRAALLGTVSFSGDGEKRLVFQLVIETLKFQKVLDRILEECAFFTSNAEFLEDYGIVLVAFYDLMRRKFHGRDESTIDDGRSPSPTVVETQTVVVQIENALYEMRVKLSAALARFRIKARVHTVDELVPEETSSGSKDKLKVPTTPDMHVFCWVNRFKTRLDKVLSALELESFKEVRKADDLKGRTFLLDRHCDDTLAFPSKLAEVLSQHPLVRDAHLVIQDKSSCIGVHSAVALLKGGSDILHVNAGSGLTSVHLASLCKSFQTTVYAFGVNNPVQYQTAVGNVERLGAKGKVQIFEESILDVESNDERLRQVQVVLLSAECSRSGVAKPINFLITENEDIGILDKLLRSDVSDSRLSELISKHTNQLRHVLKFGRVQGVVYSTRSLKSAENEEVVTRALEYANSQPQRKKTPFMLAPPVIKLTEDEILSEDGGGGGGGSSDRILHGKYLLFQPSQMISGCFVATIIREAEDAKLSAKDVIARSLAKGLIGGVDAAAYTTELEKSSPTQKRATPKASIRRPLAPAESQRAGEIRAPSHKVLIQTST